MKAFGIPLTDDHDNCFGICIDENYKFLGQWTSSNYSWLKHDLATHAKEYDYSFVDKPPYHELAIIIMRVCSSMRDLK